jgi:hypothetical protein
MRYSGVDPRPDAMRSRHSRRFAAAHPFALVAVGVILAPTDSDAPLEQRLLALDQLS